MSVGAALGGAVLGAFALAGCQSLDMDWMKRAPAEPARAEASDPAALRLAEAGERALEAFSRLADARSRDMPAAMAIPRHVAPELQRKVTVDLLGPLETVAERLAEEAGYDFVVVGARPAVPVMVEVGAKDEPLIFVLNDAGMQAGQAALLTVDAGRMLVRLDWLDGASVKGVRDSAGESR